MSDPHRYANDPAYREAYKETERQRYHNDPDTRDRAIKRAKDGYAQDPAYRQRHIGHAKAWKDRNREHYLETTRTYNQRRYQEDEAFREDSKKASKARYRDVVKPAAERERRIREQMILDFLAPATVLRKAYDEQIARWGGRPSLKRRFALALGLFEAWKASLETQARAA